MLELVCCFSGDKGIVCLHTADLNAKMFCYVKLVLSEVKVVLMLHLVTLGFLDKF